MATGKSAAIFSVAVASAQTEGGDPDSNILPQPDLGGLTYKGMATTTGSVDAFNFSEGGHEEEQGRRTVGQSSIEPIGVINKTGMDKFDTADGDFFRAGYPDSVAVSHRFKTAQGNDPMGEGFGVILGSSMGLYEPGAASVLVQDDSADGSSVAIDINDVDKVKVGAPVRIAGPGQIVSEYAIITQIIDAGANKSLKLHPALERTPQNGDTLELCYAFYPVIGSDNCKANDFHARFSMGGSGTDASYSVVTSGNRCSGFSISNSDGGASLEMSFTPLVALGDNTNADAVECNEGPGALLQHRYGCRVDLAASHTGLGSGVSTQRTFLANLDHTISCEFSIAPGTPETRGLMRGGSMEVHNSMCTVSIRTEANSDLAKMLTKQEQRTLILGFGPAGDGEGACFILKNGGRDGGDASVTGGDANRIEQETTLRAIENFSGCDLTGLDPETTRLATAPYILVLPKK